jgi:hypothetical protein
VVIVSDCSPVEEDIQNNLCLMILAERGE